MISNGNSFSHEATERENGLEARLRDPAERRP